MTNERVTCPICSEKHGPEQALSFDGKGINSCGMYKTRLATFQTPGDAGNLGDVFASSLEMLKLLKEINTAFFVEGTRKALLPSMMRTKALIHKAEGRS